MVTTAPSGLGDPGAWTGEHGVPLPVPYLPLPFLLPDMLLPTVADNSMPILKRRKLNLCTSASLSPLPNIMFVNSAVWMQTQVSWTPKAGLQVDLCEGIRKSAHYPKL